MQFLIILAIVIGAIYYFTGGKYGTDKVFGPPETLPFSRYEEVDVNVYFYYPNGREQYLGRTSGASSCGAMARNFASNKNVSHRDWGYVCCTIEDGSECYRKIR